MTIQELLAGRAAEAFNQLFGTVLSPSDFTIQRTVINFREQGDFSLVVFPLLKLSKKSPEETARLMGNKLQEITDEIESFSVIKGFLNLRIKQQFWVDFITKKYTNTSFGLKKPEGGKPVVVEFSSPNTNKPLHLGHIRNNLLGFSVSKILEANGQSVKRVNLVNDRGIHICKSMLAWKLFGNNVSPESSGKKGDKLVGDFYVLFDKKFKEECGSLVAKGLSEEEAGNRSNLMSEARNMLRKWEQQDPETRALWSMMNQWVYKGFEETYRQLGIVFDKTYYESETYLLGKKLVDEGLKKGVLFRKDDNSIWIDLTSEGLDEKLLLRADGTSVYMTQDLGTAQLRYDEFNPSEMIYVVGNEQNYHFDVLKLVLKKLDKEWADHIFHLSYGMVELPEGKMKSREGTVVDADDLIEEMKVTARQMTEELGKIDDFDSEEAVRLYDTVGLGALKYFILKVDPKKNMVFNPSESIDFNGNTGPFIQYTYARIKSVLRKAEGQDFTMQGSVTLYPKEISLSILNYMFPQVINDAATEYSPSVIANYLFELAKEYNQFYHEHPILKEENTNSKDYRLALSVLTASVLKNGMKLLGIEVPERM
ncbi:MAG TPA: arginine--tRNA ligase [Lentimicrobium sp.]|nr:arginine--tRNA ligase [Lentimicrobium sp.]